MDKEKDVFESKENSELKTNSSSKKYKIKLVESDKLPNNCYYLTVELSE